MKKGLIFDMDGTLWDSSENVAASWTEKIRELDCGLPDITRKDIMNVMGLTMDGYTLQQYPCGKAHGGP